MTYNEVKEYINKHFKYYNNIDNYWDNPDLVSASVQAAKQEWLETFQDRDYEELKLNCPDLYPPSIPDNMRIVNA